MADRSFAVVSVPLVEATIEVRFPGDARIDAHRGDFQQEIHDAFPVLMVPKVQGGEAVALTPYRFMNEEKTRTLALSIHLFAYLSNDYPGWDSFRREFINYWDVLRGYAPPQHLSRVGMRFINRFSGELLEELVSNGARPYLAAYHAGAVAHGSASRFITGDVSLNVNVKWAEEDEKSVTLDLDAFTENVEVSSLSDTLEMLHDTIEAEFRSVLKREYVEALGIPHQED